MPEGNVPDVCKTCLANMKEYEHCDFNGAECSRLNQAEWLNAHCMKFASMDEMKHFVDREHKQVKEWLCPNLDIEHPTIEHMKECDNGAYCDNHWACHTFRHLFGSRE
jgi:hypothetical protein